MTAMTAPRALEIRPLERDEPQSTFDALARLLADAYPIMRLRTAEELAEHAARLHADAHLPQTRWVVAERDDTLAGAMRLYDYTMNVRGRDALAGGVGSVGVARSHKRQGIARALIAWYLEHYRERGAPFAILHPFRFDFYRALGFGYGTPVHRYRFAPATLRDDGARGTIRELGARDADAVIACYERVRATTNGLAAFQRWRLERLLDDAALRYVAVEDGGEIRAFMQTGTVTPDDDLARGRDELLVRDVIAEDAPYRAALFRYLRSQQDQFARVMVESQDGALYLGSTDPRDGSDESVAPPTGHRIARTGQGMMYRILDMESAFAHLPAPSSPFTLHVTVDDPFFAPTNGTWTFRFAPGGVSHDGSPIGHEPFANARITGEPPADATLRIGIADLSSIVVGSLRLRDIVRNGLAAVEPRAMTDRVDAAFLADEPPVCITRF
jgi:predicted acetyltransferase